MKAVITLAILFSFVTSGIQAQTHSNDPLKELLSRSYLFNNSDQHVGKKKVQHENRSTAFNSRLIAESYYDNTGTIFEKKDTSRYFLSGDRGCEIYDYPKMFDSSYIFQYLMNTNNGNNDSGGGKIFQVLDNNSNILYKYLQAWDLSLNTLDSQNYEANIYDNNNNLLEHTLYSIVNGWHPTSKYLYSYDNADNILTYTVQTSQLVNNIWIWNNVFKYTLTYSQSNPISITKQDWTNNSWLNVQYDSLSYNLSDSLIYHEKRYWNDTTNTYHVSVRLLTQYNNDGCPIYGVQENTTDTGWMQVAKRTSTYYPGSCRMHFDTVSFYSTLYNHMQIGNARIWNNYLTDNCPTEMLLYGADSNNVILSLGRYQYDYNNYNQMTKKRYDIWDNTTGTYVTSPYSFINNYYYEEYGSAQNVETRQHNEIANIFPNPANDELNIYLPLKEKQTITVTITDMLGKTIMHLEESVTDVFNRKLDVKAIPNGNYFLCISNKDKNVTRKFTINRN